MSKANKKPFFQVQQHQVFGGRPYDATLEKTVLGLVMATPGILQEVPAGFEPATFYVEAHAEICAQILEQNKAMQPYDPALVAAGLQQKGLFEAIGGQPVLEEILLEGSKASATLMSGYLEALMQLRLRRNLYDAGVGITEKAMDGTLPYELARAESEQTLADLERPAQAIVMTAGDLACELFKSLESRHKRENTKSVPWGLYMPDSLTFGFPRKELSIIAGRPGQGKSTVVQYVARVMAQLGYGVLIFSFEMPAEAYFARMQAPLAGVPYRDIINESYTDDQEEALITSLTTLGELPFYICDHALDITGVITVAKTLAAKTSIDCIIVDHMGLMTRDPKNEVNELGAISFGLKNLAKELNCAMIALHQLNRGVEERNNKRPSLADLRGSGKIEENAALVAFLYRDEYYNPDTAHRGELEILIEKQRNGPTGIAKVLCDIAYASLSNLPGAIRPTNYYDRLPVTNRPPLSGSFVNNLMNQAVAAGQAAMANAAQNEAYLSLRRAAAELEAQGGIGSFED